MPEHSLPPQKFFQPHETFAVVGASSDFNTYGYALFLELEKKGYPIVPIHPTENTICGVASFPNFTSLPEVQRVIFASPDEELCLEYLRQMRDTGLKYAWFEEGFATPQMEEFARLNFFEVVKGINLLSTLRKV